MGITLEELEEKLRASSYENSDLVFATGKGTPLDAQNIVNRYFKPLLKQEDLPLIRWHDLRHTCATLLLGRGVHPKLVQHLLYRKREAHAGCALVRAHSEVRLAPANGG
jgi:integrase